MRRQIHPSYHFYLCLVGFILAVALILLFAPPTSFLPSSALWLLIAALFLVFSILHPTPLTLIFVFLSGLIFASCRLAPELHAREQWGTIVGQTVTITGILTEDPDLNGSQTSLRLTNLQLVENPVENSQLTAPSTTPVLPGTAYIQLSGARADLLRSDRLTLRGKIGDSFGTFVFTMRRPEILSIARADPGDLFARLKTWFSAAVRDQIPSPAAELGLGYLIGQKSSLPEDLEENLKLTGMTHVIVASGSHLGVLVALARKLFGKISRFAELFLSLAAIAFFLGLVGLTPSMLRAGLVSSLTILCGFFGRKLTPLRLLLFAAFLTLLISPIDFLNLGWQLSFASFTGLILIAPRLTKFFYGGKKPSLVPEMILTSLATLFTCAPILIYNFGDLSLLALLANLIILPTLPYAMLLVFLAGLTNLLPILSPVISFLATNLLNLHITVINFLSEKSLFVLHFTPENPLIFLLYLAPVIAYAIAFCRKVWYNRIMGTIKNEAEMIKFGEDFAKNLTFPAVIELIGDVGAGKTTFTRGLAKGLGVSEPITSPSFTLSKRYNFPGGELVHYDFYRLNDPGIMRDEIAETLSAPNTVTVVEWGGDVADLLPKTKHRLEITLREDGSREVKL